LGKSIVEQDQGQIQSNITDDTTLLRERMKPTMPILYELLLIFASVLIFRSSWMLLDRILFMNLEFGIWASLILGVLVAFLSFWMLNKHLDERKKH